VAFISDFSSAANGSLCPWRAANNDHVTVNPLAATLSSTAVRFVPTNLLNAENAQFVLLQGQVLSLLTHNDMLLSTGQDKSIHVWKFDAAAQAFGLAVRPALSFSACLAACWPVPCWTHTPV
jgi:hypothetical protein